MKIIVTGGAGFIGSAVIRRAVNDGHQIVNVDCLTYASNLSALNSVSDNPNYVFEKLNINDGPAMGALFERHQPDAIMHLAAESHVDRSIDKPADFIQTNIIGTFNLLHAARAYWNSLSVDRKENFRFHHISTDEVYGDLSPDDPAFEEETRYDPSSPYSASKAASDHLVRAWSRTYGLPTLITNCSNNYGPYQFVEKLIPVVILKALNRDPIPVYGSGDNIRDWLYVDDHVDALLHVLKNGVPGQSYNIGGNNERSNLELVKTLCGLIDAKLNNGFAHEQLISFVTDRPGHDRRYAINASKLKSELGWAPSISWNDGFAKTVTWYLDNEAWWRPLLKDERLTARQGLSQSSRDGKTD